MTDLLFDYSKRSAHLFVVFLLLYEISSYIANDMIMPGMMEVVHSFHASDSMVSASLTAFILGGASLQLFLGPISDRYGRRPVMIWGAVFFLICTLIIAASQSITQFILARYFQGMGLCFISVIGYATLQEIFSEMYAVRLIALMNNITILAPLAGPLAGSLVIQLTGWRMVFVIIALLTLIAVIGLSLYMPETVGTRRTDGSITESTPLTFSTIKRNYTALLKHKRFMLGSFSLGLAHVPIIAWIGTSPLILIKVAHLKVIYYGLWQIPIFFASILGNFAMRKSTYRKTLHQLTEFGSTVIVVGLIITGLLPLLINASYVWIIVGISFYSFGLGFTSAPLNRLVLFSTSVPKGTAAAMSSMILMMTISIGNELAGWIYSDLNNVTFSLFCGLFGLIYLFVYRLMLRAPHI